MDGVVTQAVAMIWHHASDYVAILRRRPEAVQLLSDGGLTMMNSA